MIMCPIIHLLHIPVSDLSVFMFTKYLYIFMKSEWPLVY